MTSEMKHVAAECERRAAEFRAQAEKTFLVSKRTFFLELEQQWLHLACIYYQADRSVRALRRCDEDSVDSLNASGHTIH
jgi:hypothetical protein